LSNLKRRTGMRPRRSAATRKLVQPVKTKRCRRCRPRLPAKQLNPQLPELNHEPVVLKILLNSNRLLFGIAPVIFILTAAVNVRAGGQVGGPSIEKTRRPSGGANTKIIA